eukprot:Platyproteum_vivax@DN952_c0_g1_i1.p1
MSGSVFDRLTDTSKYTGAHKERFDDSGKGKGHAGREEIVDYTGDTQSSNRNSKVDDTVGNRAKKEVVHGQMGKEKFGTQAETPISIHVYRNGDKHHAGNKVMIKKSINSMEKLLAEVMKVCPSQTGPVKKLYCSDLKTVVKDLSDLVDGGRYCVCGGEKPSTKDKLPAALFE